MVGVGEPEFDISDEQVLREHIGEPAETSKHRLKFTKILTETQTEFIGRSPFCLLSTLDTEGVPCVSPKGDAPGFVEVLAPNLVLVPERPGNKLIYSLKNILGHPKVQIIFFVPKTCETLRISGLASLSRDPMLCRRCAAGGQDALLVIRVQITECYYHCAKALLRSQLWNPAAWPQVRHKISLGQIMAKNGGKDAKWVEEYEKGAVQRLKDVEGHYLQKVWKFRRDSRQDVAIAAACALACVTVALAARRWRKI